FGCGGRHGSRLASLADRHSVSDHPHHLVARRAELTAALVTTQQRQKQEAPEQRTGLGPRQVRTFDDTKSPRNPYSTGTNAQLPPSVQDTCGHIKTPLWCYP